MQPPQGGPPIRLRIPGLFVPAGAVNDVYHGWVNPAENGETITLHHHQLGAGCHLREGIAVTFEDFLIPRLKPRDVLDATGHSLGAIGVAILLAMRYTESSELPEEWRSVSSDLQEMEIEIRNAILTAGPWRGHGLANLVGRTRLPYTAGIRCLQHGSRMIAEVLELLEPIAVMRGAPPLTAVQPAHDGFGCGSILEIPGVRNVPVPDAPRFSHFQPSHPSIVGVINSICAETRSRRRPAQVRVAMAA